MLPLLQEQAALQTQVSDLLQCHRVVLLSSHPGDLPAALQVLTSTAPAAQNLGANTHSYQLNSLLAALLEPWLHLQLAAPQQAMLLLNDKLVINAALSLASYIFGPQQWLLLLYQTLGLAGWILHCQYKHIAFVTSAYAQIFINKCCIKLAFSAVWSFDWKQTKDLEESELDTNSALGFRSQVSRYRVEEWPRLLISGLAVWCIYKLIYWAIWPSQGWSALAKYASTCGVPELPFAIDLWR